MKMMLVLVTIFTRNRSNWMLSQLANRPRYLVGGGGSSAPGWEESPLVPLLGHGNCHLVHRG